MNDVRSDSRFLSAGGTSLSVEERSNCAISLPLLRAQSSLSWVWLWGKLVGQTGDYLVAQGFEEPLDTALSYRLYISTDSGLQWELLATPTELERFYCGKIEGLFVGKKEYQYLVVKDPSVEPAEEEADAVEPQRRSVDEDEDEEEAEAEEEEAPPKSRLRQISEAVRVACIVETINQDTAVVPRGAFLLNAQENVVKNRAFEGLDTAEAGKLRNYLHFRPAEALEKKTLLEREHLSASLDFLDQLTDDIPHGCWTLQFDSLENAVLLRNLVWQGYTFFHVPNTLTFGGCYIGHGQKNMDLGFML